MTDMTILMLHKNVLRETSIKAMRVIINITGNPSMATGGSGDVLTGVISSFIAQGIDPFFAAAAGAYIHGLSGDICKDKMGSYGVMSWDIAENIADAIKQFR